MQNFVLAAKYVKTHDGKKNPSFHRRHELWDARMGIQFRSDVCYEKRFYFEKESKGSYNNYANWK